MTIMRAYQLNRKRRGFTILEVMVSMVIFLVVMATAANIFKNQTRAVAQHAGRLDAQQNARFALSTLERELRMGGVALGDGQPALVLAGPLSVGFNTNLVARDTVDWSAVYTNTDADVRAVGVWPAAKAMTLPGTTDAYPDTTYEVTAGSGTPSRAETILYWLSKDSTSPRSDEYIMWRRVNYAPPTVVTKGVLVGATDTVFQYFTYDSTNTLKAVSPTRLPATHVAKVHRALGDTGKFALVDSIRAVRVRLRTIHRDPRGGDAIREYAGRVTIFNAGVAGRSTCGSAPLPVTVSATKLINADGNPYVNVSWGASGDEESGEKDVERYAVYRRPANAASFDQEPLVSIPAGELAYSYNDIEVTGGQWVYGVTAQDCTPASSVVSTSVAIDIPILEPILEVIEPIVPIVP
jgi:prepilin-type N-terminal cleavage/methylation domain-containing protein